MASRKTEFLATIKPILDKSQVKQDVRELAEELRSILDEQKVGVDANSLKEIGEVFNQQLKDLGKQPIIFSDIEVGDGALKKLVSRFTEAFGAGLKGALSNIDYSKEIEKLRAKQEQLNTKKDKLQKKYNSIKDYPDTVDKPYSNFRTTPLKSDVDKQAESIMNAYYGAADNLDKMQRGTEAYFDALVEAFTKANEVISMGKTLYNHETALKNEEAAVFYEDAKDSVMRIIDHRTYLDDITQYIASLKTYAFTTLPQKIEQIDLKLTELAAKSGDVISSQTDDTIQQIEDAKRRIETLTPTKKHKKETMLQDALNYATPKNQRFSLTAIAKQYQESRTRGDDWEEQYAWLIKFVRAYEAYSQKKVADEKQQKALLKHWKPLYETSSPHLSRAVDMLQRTLGVEGTKNADSQSSGSGSGDVLGGGSGNIEQAKQLADEAERKAQAEKLAAEEAEKKRLAEEAALKAAKEKEQIKHTSQAKTNPDWFLNLSAYNEAVNGSVKITENAERDVQAQQAITREMQQQADILPKLIHIGRFEGFNLQDFVSSDRMGEAPRQTDNEFGIYGDGLFTVQSGNLDAIIDLLADYGSDKLEGQKIDGFQNKIHIIDPSEYDFYVNKTTEEAGKFGAVMQQMQKFIFSQAGIQFTEPLSEQINSESVYKNLQQIVKGFTWSFEEFDRWITQRVAEIKQHGWMQDTNGETFGKFVTDDKEFLNSHNLVARLMKEFGYGGIYNQTGDISFDGFEYGTTIFDPNLEKLQSGESYEYARDFLLALGKTKDEVNTIIDAVNKKIREKGAELLGAPIESQSKNIFQYAKIGEQVGDASSADVAALQQEKDNLIHENANLRDELEIEKAQNKQAINDVISAESQTREAENKLREAEDRLREEENARTELEYTNQQLQKEIQEQDSQIQELRQTLSELADAEWQPKLDKTQAQQNDGPWALESTLSEVKTILENIKTHTAKLKNIKAATKDSKDNASQATKSANPQQDSEQTTPGETKKQIAQQKKDAGLGIATSALRAGRRTIASLWQMDDVDATSIPAVKELDKALEDLSQTQARLTKQDGVISPEDTTLLQTQTDKVAFYTKEVQELLKNYKQLHVDGAKAIGTLTTGVDKTQQIIDAIMSNTEGKARIQKIDDVKNEVTYTRKVAPYTFETYTAGIEKSTDKIVSFRTETKKTETFMESFNRKLGDIFRYFSASSLIYKAFNELRKGIQYVREIDLALTELKKVTDETDETYKKFLNTAAKTAAKVGSTIKEVVSSTADFARLGYSLKEAAAFAESAQILMNVSEFTDVSRATDTLISAVQAFGYTAETSMEVVDLLNMIGNNYAISTSDLAQSLTKSSASLVAAGGNLAEAAALTATANKIVQD